MPVTPSTAAVADRLAAPACASLFVLGAAGQGVHWVALALMHCLRQQGLRTTALMPVACDAQWHNGRWYSERVAQLKAHSSFAFPAAALCTVPAPDPSASPPRPVALRDVLDSYQALATWSDAVVVDGVGEPEALLAPELSLRELARWMRLPVVIVCEDSEAAWHAFCALLTRCRAQGIRVAGWVQLGCRPLRGDAGIPLLGTVPWQALSQPVEAAAHIDGLRLLQGLQRPSAS